MKHASMIALLSLAAGMPACVDVQDLEPTPSSETIQQSLIVDEDMDGVTGANEGVIWHQAWAPAQALEIKGTGVDEVRFCTATYLERTSVFDPPVILTAAHCVNTPDKVQVAPWQVSFWFYDDTATNPGRDGTPRRSVRTREIITKPDWRTASGAFGTNLVNRHDIALVLLQDVPRLADGSELDGAILHDGSVPTGAANDPNHNPTSVHAVGIGRHVALDSSGNHTLEFDKARRAGRVYLSSADPAGEIWRSGAVHDGQNVVSGAKTAPGDSGGPLFINATPEPGTKRIAGVLSGGLTSTNVQEQIWQWSIWAPVFRHADNDNDDWIDANRFGRCGAGSYDNNESVLQSSDLEQRFGYWRPRALTLNDNAISCALDRDIFRVGYLPIGQTTDLRVFFQHAAGDIDIDAFAGRWNFPRRSEADFVVSHHYGSATSATDNEQLAVQSQSTGDIYLRVIGYNGASNPDYTITRCDGDTRTNTSVARAETVQIGLNGATTLTRRTACPDSPRVFAFTYSKGSTRINIDFDPAWGDLDASVMDATGHVLVQRSNGSWGEVFEAGALTGLSHGQTYYLKVYGKGNRNANEFDVTFEEGLEVSGVQWSSLDPNAPDLKTVTFRTNVPALTRCYGPAWQLTSGSTCSYYACSPSGFGQSCNMAVGFASYESQQPSTQHSCTYKVQPGVGGGLDVVEYKIGAFISGGASTLAAENACSASSPAWDTVYFR